MRIILPKDRIDLSVHFPDAPLFFLAGPGDWQKDMCERLDRLVPNCVIATPTRWSNTHPLYRHRVVTSDMEQFDRQLAWERYYLELAASTHQQGCLIFWLGCQKEFPPWWRRLRFWLLRIHSDPYAMDTRGELGEWRGRMMHHPNLRVVVGAEYSFPGLDVIQHNFDQALGYDFPITSSMEKVAKMALWKSSIPPDITNHSW